MYFRQKRAGRHTYLQIVESRWEDGRSRQRVLLTLGRLDQLRESGNSSPYPVSPSPRI